VFPSGDRVPGTPETKFPLSKGAKMKLVAQKTLFEAGTPTPEYAFLFWDVDRAAYYGNQAIPSAPPEVGTASFTVPPSDFQANAWYSGPIGGGPSKPIVELSAFSLDKHAAVTPTAPFVSVSPGSVADLTTTRASGPAPAVTITAESVLIPDGRFKSWFVYAGTGTALERPTNVMTVPENDGCSAIAFYGLTKLSPDPCQTILNDIQKFGHVDPTKPIPTALLELFKNLANCQLINGEPVSKLTDT
jgi:hypothetical protein